MDKTIIWALFLGITCFAIGGRAYDSKGSLIGLLFGLTLGIFVGLYSSKKPKNKDR